MHDVSRLPGLVAMSGAEPVGVLHYRIVDDECEVVSLIAVTSGIGAGSALLAALRDRAQRSGCVRIWLVTTNDNLRAQSFYRGRGFSRSAVYPGAVTASRALKPEIPVVGEGGVRIEDEIEYELVLRA